MKIDIGESLVCSWLRHVRQCWLVQANWKFSEHWKRWCLCDSELEELFRNMKDRFDRDGKVFKKTSVKQLCKQGEMDAVGIDYEGGVHAAEIAFHEDGLHYRNPDKVLKKMLSTLLILRALRLPETRLHIYFLTAKARPGVQQSLEATLPLCVRSTPKSSGGSSPTTVSPRMSSGPRWKRLARSRTLPSCSCAASSFSNSWNTMQNSVLGLNGLARAGNRIRPFARSFNRSCGVS